MASGESGGCKKFTPAQAGEDAKTLPVENFSKSGIPECLVFRQWYVPREGISRHVQKQSSKVLCLLGKGALGRGGHLLVEEDIAGRLLQVLGQLVDIAEDGDARVGQAGPAGHLHDQAAARVLHNVARVDRQRGQAEYGVARLVRRKVHQRAKGVPRPPVVHPRHHRAQVRKLRLLHLWPHRCYISGISPAY